MSSLIKTFNTQSDFAFAKDVLTNLQNGYDLPRWAIDLLDKNRKTIYWKCYIKHRDLPEYWGDDETNIYILKQLVKHVPNVIREDYSGFYKEYLRSEGRRHIIDNRRIKRQVNKVFKIVKPLKD